MNRKVFHLIVVICSFMSIANTGQAQTTFKDPQGRFVIDIPMGWNLQPQTDDRVFFFTGGGRNIIIECVPMVNDLAELMKKAETVIRSGGMADVVLDSSVTEMTLNGLPARWSTYKGTANGVSLASLCGAVANGENGLYFFSIFPAADIDNSKGKLEKTFQTIRSEEHKVTGVENVKIVSVNAAPPVSPTPWKTDLVALTLPPGWSEKQKPRGFEKEVQGWFAYDPLPGSTLFVTCYKGWGMNMSKAMYAGIQSVTIPNPDAKPVEADELEVEGKKVMLAVYKGTGAAQGAEFEVGYVIAAKKADKCYVVLNATGLTSALPRLRSQVLEIVKTVK